MFDVRRSLVSFPIRLAPPRSAAKLIRLDLYCTDCYNASDFFDKTWQRPFQILCLRIHTTDRVVPFATLLFLTAGGCITPIRNHLRVIRYSL